MKREKILLIALLLLAILAISGCGRQNSSCTVGDSCTYYSGTQGIWTYIENPPTMMYYRSQDRKESNGNEIEINTRVENRGASDSYGAVYLTGFAPEINTMSIVDKNGEHPFRISNIKDNCYFDLDTLSGGLSLGNIFGLASCGGVTGQTNTGGWSLGFDFAKIAQEFGWDVGLNGTSFEVGRNYQDGWNFKVGVDGNYFNSMINGKALAVLVSQIDLSQFNGAVFTMKGDHANNPGGDIDLKTFKVQMTGDWPAGQDYYRVPYSVRTCYEYTTFVSPLLCVDTDPFSQENKVCTPQSYTFGGSQGAPVAVTRMDQTNTGKELILDFTIKNVGDGRVWDVGYLQSCSPYFPGSVKSSMLDVVYIGPAIVGSKIIDCSTRRVRLDPRTGEGRFTCRYDVAGAGGDIGSAYTIPLKMELWYGYEQNLNNQITIRRVS